MTETEFKPNNLFVVDITFSESAMSIAKTMKTLRRLVAQENLHLKDLAKRVQADDLLHRAIKTH